MGGVKVLSVVLLAVLSAALGASVYAATRATPGAPTAGNVVRAERFELVDSAGKVMAVLGLQTRLTQSVRIMDAEGNVVVVPEGAVASHGEGTRLPYLVLIDDAGRTRVEVTFDRAGEPVIRMMGKDGRAAYVVPPVHELKMLGS
jgi:hypothetical protein